MKKDPTEFRKRFAAWKNGEQVYKDGLPAYRGGKDSGKINYSRWDNAELTSYPVPFIDEKRITLTNAGRATGAVLSTNLLDSIADNADRAGLPLQTALGLAVKESTLGNPTDDRSAWNLSSGIRRTFNNKYPGTEQHINYWGDALNEREDVINYHKGHQSDDPASGHKSVLQEAFEFYKQHPDKYNTGQKDYQTSVDKSGAEVMQSPEIKRWKNAYDTKHVVRQWTKPNLLLKESKFNKPTYKDGKLPGYKDGGEPVKVGEYNVYPSAIGASELNVTTPEIVITGKDKRPLYQRYAAERSTYDPNAIRNFTDWLPVVGDIGTGIDIKNAIQNNNYLEASALGAMMVLPDPIARGTKKLLRPISKKVKRLFQNVDFTSPLSVRVPEAENQTWAEITAEKYADKIATKNPIPATKEEKEQFKRAWDIATRNNPIRTAEEIIEGFRFADVKDKYRFVNLVNRNPEYYEFLRREGIVDPLSQESVSRFLDNQFTSVRGVTADNIEAAKPMLQNTEPGRRMIGGDRLDTNGGLYTSNSTTIADRFKNPTTSKVGNGYIAKVRYPHNIPTNIPIEDQLEQYRKMILLSDSKNPLYGTQYFYTMKKDPNVVALESDYVGRASQGLSSVQERAYLPKHRDAFDFSTPARSEQTVDILDLQEYLNQTDQHGRWITAAEKGSKDGLFIPRMLNNYSDFIRSARVVLSPQWNKKLYRQTLSEAEDNFSKQKLRRSELTSKLYNTQRKLKNIATAGAALSPIGALLGYGVYRAKEENKFYDSPEYQQLLEDPNYEKYLNTDDGSFWKLSSIDKLEHKYKRKYQNRIGDK